MNVYAVAGFLFSPFHVLILGVLCFLPLLVGVGVMVFLLISRNRD
jgi:hypothetical protein